MTLYQYIAISENEKAIILWSKGIYIMDRFESDHTIILYSLHDFYVEVWYHAKSNFIHKLVPFRSNNPLEPYINRIKINIL